MEVVFTTVSSQSEVSQILDLQSNNLASAISPEEANSEGFVTVQHDPDVLWRMNQQEPSVIAKQGDLVVGYALIMLPSFAPEVPILLPMFDILNSLQWRGNAIRENTQWCVMGQVCVRKGFRGQGIFDGMFMKMKEVCKGRFDFMVTEVAQSNTRSLRAHEKVGFETLYDYVDGQTGESWRMVILDF